MTPRPETWPRISATQLEYLTDMARGLDKVETATKRSKSTHTVKTQLSIIYRELGARCAAHAVAIAYTEGLLPPIGSDHELNRRAL